MATMDMPEEPSLAERFDGDPGVMISATGRVCPRQCRLCTALHVPRNPFSGWRGDALPEFLYSPELADAVHTTWRAVLARLPDAAKELRLGKIPIGMLSRQLEEDGNWRGRGRRLGKVCGSLQAEQDARAATTGPAANKAVARELRAREERIGAGHETDWEKSDKWPKALAEMLEFSLRHFGECRRDAGRNTPFQRVATYPELRNRLTDWCDAGELRKDVVPDKGRRMDPIYPSLEAAMRDSPR